MDDIQNQLGALASELKTVIESKSAESSETKSAVEDIKTKLTELETKYTEAQAAAVVADEAMKNMEKRIYRVGTPAMESEATKKNLEAMSTALRTREGIRLKAYTGPEHKYASTLNGPDGGFLVVPEFVNRVLINVLEISPIRKLCNIMTVSGSSVVLPKLTQRLTAYTLGEGSALTESQMKFGQKSVQLSHMGARALFTRQVLEDPAVDILPIMAARAVEAFALLEGNLFLTGNGVGQPEGLLKDTGSRNVTSGTVGAISADDIMNTIKTIPHGYNPVLMMNKNTFVNLWQKKDGIGRYLIGNGLKDAVDFTPGNIAAYFMGLPVYIMPGMPDIATGAIPVVLADMKAAYQVIIKGGMEIQRDDLTQGQNGIVVFNMFTAVGGAVVLPDAIVTLTVA